MDVPRLYFTAIRSPVAILAILGLRFWNCAIHDSRFCAAKLSAPSSEELEVVILPLVLKGL